jgi:hypothetical protein
VFIINTLQNAALVCLKANQMKINIGSLCVLLLGAVVLYVCHNIAMERNGITLYNFLLFFSAHVFWGYFWGGRLIRIPGSEEMTNSDDI